MSTISSEVTVKEEYKYFEADEAALKLGCTARNVRYHALKWNIGKRVTSGNKASWFFTEEDIERIRKHRKEATSTGGMKAK